MPYGYLATIIIWGLATAAMQWPPHHPSWLARTVYRLSVSLNELPILALALFGLATVDTLLDGDLLTSAVGLLALAVAALVALGMVSLHVSTTKARPVVERTVGIPAGSHPFRWSWLLPVLRPTREVERLRNLRYATGGREHLLDLYRRRIRSGPAPILIYLHGGGYVSGGKHFESGTLRRRLARRGWVVLSANYSLRPQVQWPAHLIDAKRVIAWAHAHAQEYDLDTSTIVMAGSSAGAHMAVHAALTPNQADFQPGFEHVDTRLTAAVGLYGYYDRYFGRGPEESPTSHPLDLPTTTAPPIVLFHGDRDNYVPVHQARALVTHLRRGSPSTVAYAELPGAQHGFDMFASPRNRAVTEGIEHFLDQETSGPGPQQHRAGPGSPPDRPGRRFTPERPTHGQTPRTGLP